MVQASLRDAGLSSLTIPALETPGYYQSPRWGAWYQSLWVRLESGLRPERTAGETPAGQPAWAPALHWALQ